MKNENFYASRFGMRLKIERQKRGFTQKSLAEATGLTQPVLARLESGKISNPRQTTLEPIYKALKLSKKEIELLTSDLSFEINHKPDMVTVEIGVPHWLRTDESQALDIITRYIPQLKIDKSFTGFDKDGKRIPRINSDELYLVAQFVESLYNDENPKEYKESMKQMVALLSKEEPRN